MASGIGEPAEADPAAVLGFWFGRPDDLHYDRERSIWFEQDPDFDDACRARFLGLYEQAAAGAFDDWQDTPEGALALVLLLDQLPRNMFRGEARAFATDAKALAVAKKAIERGHDRALVPVRRKFLYMPFQHAENVADQRRSVALFETLADTEAGRRSLDYARRHLEIIERFGRFPHRNAVLGRASTEEELAFLREEDPGF